MLEQERRSRVEVVATIGCKTAGDNGRKLLNLMINKILHCDHFPRLVQSKLRISYFSDSLLCTLPLYRSLSISPNTLNTVNVLSVGNTVKLWELMLFMLTAGIICSIGWDTSAKAQIDCRLHYAQLITRFPWTAAQRAVYNRVYFLYPAVRAGHWNYIGLVPTDAPIPVYTAWLLYLYWVCWRGHWGVRFYLRVYLEACLVASL